jgi:hypothetical protein
MSDNTEEVRALNSGAARAIRHYLLIWLGFPAIALVVTLTMSGVAARIESSQPLSALALAIVGCLVTWVSGRWLWKAFRK